MSDLTATPAAPITPITPVNPVTAASPAPLAPVTAAAPTAPVASTPAPAAAPVAPTAPAAVALTPEQLDAMLHKAITDALSFHQASLDSAAIVHAPPKSLIDIAWVPDVRTALSWAETRVAIAAVAICGLVPTVMSIWTGAPPQVHDFVQHYLPTGTGAAVATALFVLQSAATLMNFKAGARANP